MNFSRSLDRGHPELFWALRGRKGNFGVVTEVEIDLFPVTRLYGGGLYFAGEHIGPVLHSNMFRMNHNITPE